MRGQVLSPLTWRHKLSTIAEQGHLNPSLVILLCPWLLFLREYLFLGWYTKTVLQLDKVQAPSGCKASALLKWPWTGQWVPGSTGNTALCSAMQFNLSVRRGLITLAEINALRPLIYPPGLALFIYLSNMGIYVDAAAIIYVGYHITSYWDHFSVIRRSVNIIRKTKTYGHTGRQQTSSLS